MQSTQHQSVQQQPLQPVPVAKRLHWFINSPWLLLVVPLLVGGFWLVLNPWVITSNLDKPYALLAGPSLVGSCIIGWLFIKFFRAIERGIKSSWAAFLKARQEDGNAQFFWIVILVFLAVSVAASGSFFTQLERAAFPGLGYATALFIDLITVQFMRARLNATRMRDRKGAALYLLGVFICAGASAFANVYTSLQDFNGTVSGALPGWMVTAAPWFGLVFPALIVLLSMTADHTVDQYSGVLDPEKYRTQESKRVQMLEIQRDLLRDRVRFEREIDQLTARLKGGDRRVFAPLAWLMPKLPDVQLLVDEAQKDASTRLEALAKQNSDLLAQLQATQQSQMVDYNAIAQSVVPLLVPALGENLRQEREAVLLEVQSIVSAQLPQVNHSELAAVLAPMVFTEDRVNKMVSRLVPPVTPELPQVNHSELAAALVPMVLADDRVNKQETPVDSIAIAQSVVPLLEPALEDMRASLLSEVQSLLTSLPVQETQGNGVVSSNGYKETEQIPVVNEAAITRIQAVLRENPSATPTELAAATGATKGYASRVKSQFLAAQQQQ